MSDQKLTKRVVDAAAPKNNRYVLWDSTLQGFGLRVYPSGQKSFVVRKRLGRGKRQILRTIGQYGHPLTVEVAKKRAASMLLSMHDGLDPADQSRTDCTLNEFAPIFVNDTKGHKKPNSISKEQSMIDRHILPRIGKYMVSEITTIDVTRLLNAIATQAKPISIKTGYRGRAIVRGGPGAANRSRAVLSTMMTHAITLGIRTDNPVLATDPFPSKKMERYLKLPELDRLRAVLREAELNGVNPFAVAAIRIIAYTGARKNEVLSLKWDYIDRGRSCAFLPDSKTGAKPLRLPTVALEQLDELPRLSGSPWVFPSTTGEGHLIGLQKIWEKLRVRAGLEDVRIHDLRHTFASIAVSAGHSLPTIGRALGHTQASTTERYAHLADDPVNALVEDTAQRIGRL